LYTLAGEKHSKRRGVFGITIDDQVAACTAEHSTLDIGEISRHERIEVMKRAGTYCPGKRCESSPFGIT
jgi:hypothetical protein